MLNAEKTKTRRSKQRNFSLRKALMAQARLQNRLLEEKSEELKKLYNKPRNFCVKFLRKSKRHHFS